jgi:hypothetical protein
MRDNDSVTNTKSLRLCTEIFSVYCENHITHANTLCLQVQRSLTFKARRTYKNHSFRALSV